MKLYDLGGIAVAFFLIFGLSENYKKDQAETRYNNVLTANTQLQAQNKELIEVNKQTLAMLKEIQQKELIKESNGVVEVVVPPHFTLGASDTNYGNEKKLPTEYPAKKEVDKIEV